MAMPPILVSWILGFKGNWVDFLVFWGLDSDIGIGFDIISFLFLFLVLVFWGFVLCRYGEFKGVRGFVALTIGEAVWRDEADIYCKADYLELEKFLVDVGLCERKEEAIKITEVLDRLGQILKDWMKQLTCLRGYTNRMVENANVVLFTFGSYRLGVHGPRIDIDTSCIGPSYESREEDFFFILHNILADMEEVTKLHPIPDAHILVM